MDGLRAPDSGHGSDPAAVPPGGTQLTTLLPLTGPPRAYLDVSPSAGGHPFYGGSSEVAVFTNGRYREHSSPRPGAAGSRDPSAERSHGAGCSSAPCGIMKFVLTMNPQPPMRDNCTAKRNLSLRNGFWVTREPGYTLMTPVKPHPPHVMTCIIHGLGFSPGFVSVRLTKSNT
ncbi:hypothetical protein NHX12_031601 [Muraenolepis orangiensis]|uniref:Uncharacterized protein n=1 Tax=Muraenolepis orangiensis TaxID=630683 RepID=A0A9Q0E5K4_9TELE|nr:hypothetical protein NHX12_031601 [Muraenolepis orangiensis]